MISRRSQIETSLSALTAELAALPPDPPAAPVRPSAFMTAAAYAEHLQISPRTLRRLIKEGLPVVRPRPKLIRIPVADATAWMARSQHSAIVAAYRGSIS